MKTKFIKKLIIFLSFLMLNANCAGACNLKENEGIDEYKYNITMKRDLLCLMMAYPDFISNIEKGNDNNVYIVTKSGKRIIYDDKKEKSFNEKLDNPDLQDMLEQVYPLSNDGKLMEENFDPGRIRVYPLFKEVYGNSKQQVEKNLARTRAGYGYSTFNGNNKASQSLESAMREIVSLTQRNKGAYSYVFPTMGTFNYRLISGTNQLSVHSFGIAIDFATSKWDYWKWANREQGQKRLDSYPKEIVEIMERNNFIWGGKWGHFDIMHYEYRPELILKARYFSCEPSEDKPWYEGINYDENIKEYIQLIDKAVE
ncbi:MAG: Peptidase-M15-4 domain-containing protein [Clostridium sp.]|jgi:hypothetical protein